MTLKQNVFHRFFLALFQPLQELHINFPIAMPFESATIYIYFLFFFFDKHCNKGCIAKFFKTLLKVPIKKKKKL